MPNGRYRWTWIGLLSLLGVHCSGAERGVDGGVVSEAGEDGGQTDARVVDAGPPTDLSRAFVQTTTGPVHGESRDGMAILRGVPYAAAPTDDRRWRAPGEVESWVGVREATRFGAACPQPTTPFIPGFEVPDQSEDCLTLNVWTPASRVEQGLPVMVWLHGGGYTIGAGSLDVYEGSRLAELGNVVVITLNYRLGPLGFMAHPDLSREQGSTSGNYGLLDQLAALEWVRDNARELGGDPDNVTIFGESAGGGSVCFLLASSLSEGLFHRAIVQSADCQVSLRDRTTDSPRLASGEALGEIVSENLGCDESPDPLSCMREASFDELLVAGNVASGGFADGEKFWPMVEGHVLLEQPEETFAAGRHQRVPVIVGTTADEAALFRSSFATVRTVRAYRGVLSLIFGGAASQVMEAYPVAHDSDAFSQYERLLTDYVFLCPTRRYARVLSRHGPLWLYQLTHAHPSGVAEGMGVYHGTDIFYTFGNLDPENRWAGSIDADDHAVAESMMGYWTQFARTGDPNSGDLPGWRAYDLETDQHQNLRSPVGGGGGLRTTQCDLFDSL